MGPERERSDHWDEEAGRPLGRSGELSEADGAETSNATLGLHEWLTGGRGYVSAGGAMGETSGGRTEEQVRVELKMIPLSWAELDRRVGLDGREREVGQRRQDRVGRELLIGW